jgi:7-cyano-7-deazaguanine reductase
MTDQRPLLTIHPNPGSHLDYVVELTGTVATGTVTVRYVPDRWLLDSQAFHNYLENLKNSNIETPEATGIAILDDFNNEVVPRWLQVTLALPGGDGTARAEHRILLEDRQPNWDNLPLLSHLRRF